MSLARFLESLLGTGPDDGQGAQARRAGEAAEEGTARRAPPDDAALVAALLDAFERDPARLALLDEVLDDEIEGLARRAGALPWVRLRLVRLRARLDQGDLDDVGDEIRETYSELLDDHADDPAALALIRPLGRRIEELEAAGALPRALIRRSSRSRRR